MILETYYILFADEVPEILKKIIFEFMKTWSKQYSWVNVREDDRNNESVYRDKNVRVYL